MPHLRYIVYASDAAPDLDVRGLEAILAESRHHNLAHGITGVLLHGEGRFMQYFEGPEAAVKATFDRILRSSRHTGIVTLEDMSRVGRLFGEWTMGSVAARSSEILRIVTARWQYLATAPGRDEQGPSGLDALKAFWRASQGWLPD